MTREEALKLAGGYATNTLTPEERAALFQAALEDQAIFDALQKEQGLRELLDDAASRAIILDAIQESPPAWRRIPSLWWAAGGALAAGLFAVLMLHPSRPAAPPPPPTQMSAKVNEPLHQPTAPAPSEAIAPPAGGERTNFKRRPATPAPRPAAPPPAASAEAALDKLKTGAGVAGTVSNAARMQAPAPAETELLRANAAGEFEPLETAAVANGDHIRVAVTPRFAGSAALYRLNDAGGRSLLFPGEETGIPVAAGQRYVLPAAGSITVDGDMTLEISIRPEKGDPQRVVIHLRPH